MKLIVLTGSPHKQGTTAQLAAHYCSGAEQAGHEVARFDLADCNIHPCTGCNHCQDGNQRCVFRDEMDKIVPVLLAADRVVLVSPLYYFGFTAQLKAGIDRLYAVNQALLQADKELELLSAGADKDSWARDAITAHAQAIARYWGWSLRPPLIALGCAVPEDLAGAGFLQRAQALGRGSQSGM